MALEVGVMHAALRQQIGDGVTHDFADPQLTLRAAGGGVLFVVTGHCRLSKSSCPRVSRASTSFLLNQVGRGWPGHLARRRASRFSPAMTPHFQSIISAHFVRLGLTESAGSSPRGNTR